MIMQSIYSNIISSIILSFFSIAAPSKPKFLDKFFTNVGLSKKLQGRTRNGLVIQTVTTGTGDIENPEEDLTIARECDLLGTVSEPPTEACSPCEEVPEKTTQSTPNSPKLSGIVRRRLLEYQQIGTGNRGPRLRSASTPSSPSFKRKGFIHLNHQTSSNSKGESSLTVLCSGLSRNEQFRQTVMSKGFVKALVDQYDGQSQEKDGKEKPKAAPKTENPECQTPVEKTILEIPNVKPSDVVKTQHSPKLSKKDVEKFVKSSPSVHKKPSLLIHSDHSNCSSGTNSPGLSPTPKKHVFNSNRCSSSSHKSSSSDNDVVVTSSPRNSRKNKELVPKEQVVDAYENVTVEENGSKSDISNSVKSLSSGCYSNGVSSVGQEEGETTGEGVKLNLDPAKLFDSSWSDSDVGSFSDFDSDLEEEHPEKVKVDIFFFFLSVCGFDRFYILSFKFY